MDEYKPNSDKYRKEQEEKKKLKPVISGKTTAKKKSGVQKVASAFTPDDMDNVKSYILLDVVVPIVKKALSEIISTGTDIMLYGEAGVSKKKTMASKTSYGGYYEGTNLNNRDRAHSSYRNRGFDYDDIIFDTRGDAEMVLDTMFDIIGRYGAVSVQDLYELADIPNENYTMTRYGWTRLGSASVQRCPEGYVIKLPRVEPLNN